MYEQTVDMERIEQIVNLFGNFDENVKHIEKKHAVTITSHVQTWYFTKNIAPPLSFILYKKAARIVKNRPLL